MNNSRSSGWCEQFPPPSAFRDGASTIYEDVHRDVNVGERAIGYLKSCLRLDTPVEVDMKKLKSLILRSWKHFNDFAIACDDSKLWMIEVDFKKPGMIDKAIAKIDPGFSTKFGESNGSYGLFVSLSNGGYAIIIDIAARRDGKKLQHEFTHFVQLVTGKLKSNVSSLAKKLDDKFKLNGEYASYVLSDYEFMTHLYVDVFNCLQKIYWSAFKNFMKWREFVKQTMDQLSVDFARFEDTVLFAAWAAYCPDSLKYVSLIAAIGYASPDLFAAVVERLMNGDVKQEPN